MPRICGDDVREYVVEHLGDADGVLIVDETGFLKKGTRSAGVQRQYSGTAGRTEHCQIGTFLAYASTRGRALIDRELYMPASWIEDRERCRRAGVPDHVEFATKPQKAQQMIARAIAAGVPFRWLTADEAYGEGRQLRAWLEQHEVFYVLATKRNDTAPAPCAIAESQLDDLVAALGPRSWHRRSAGAGAHGQRFYDWARIALRSSAPGRQPPGIRNDHELIPLTVNEIRRLLAALGLTYRPQPNTSMTGPTGDAAATLKPVAATTNGAVTNPRSHDWPLQY